MRLLAVGHYTGSTFIGTRYLVNPEGISLQQATTQTEMVSRIADTFVQEFIGASAPNPSDSSRDRLRRLARFRRSLRASLRQRGLPVHEVERTAYRLAVAMADGRSRVARHVLMASAAPAIWLGRARLTRRAAPGGRRNDRGDG